MKYDLRRPCKQCPFRTDCLEGWLSRGRAVEIASSIQLKGAEFACHETTEATGSDGPERHCAGALLLMEKNAGANQLARIAGRCGVYDPDKLDFDAPVFDTWAEFVAHHEDPTRPMGETCSVVEDGCLAPAGYAIEGGTVDGYETVDTECVSCGEAVCENEACSRVVAGERVCSNCEPPE